MQRTLSLDVYDYSGHALCNLYDNTNDIVGQAHDVYVHTERNGFKELRFNLPSVCEDEKNYRLDFLVADYRIRFREVKNGKEEIDWFIISEPKVTHSTFSTDYEIRAGHISQLLNTKNLNLEFSDNEGNNVGTIAQIAATILEGTGWHLGNVATFYEEDKYNAAGKEKVRSFTASAKTGAFKMMNDLCEMFDAKPIYHGEGTYEEDGIQKTGRTVDILPINPFSEKLDEGVVPPDLNQNKVLELYYDKNISNISRTLNTESLVTVLTAYGSYGDENGMASLQNAEHAEISFGTLNAGNYRFVHNRANYYFSINKQISNLKWSSLDFVSRSYVYNGTKLFNVSKEPQEGISYTLLEVQPVYVKNKIPYVMDFSYYYKIGLLTDEMILELAQAQTALPAKHITAEEASLALSDAKQELSRTASSGGGFLMLDISSSDVVDGQFQLTLNKEIYSDGVIFRSDYDEAKRNYFSWNTATGIKDSGEAIAGRGAVVYVVHQGNPTKWEKSYVKTLGNGIDDYYRDSLGNTYNLHNKIHKDDYDHFPAVGTENIIYIADDTEKMYTWFNNSYQEIQASGYFYGLNEFEEPLTIKLWSTEDTWHSGDKVYLFSADAIAGVFGPREDSIYSNRKSIEEAVKVSTETHPVYFITENDDIPSQTACLSSYGWYYKSYQNTYSFGDLYFCWGKNGDLGWNKVYVSNEDKNPEKISVISGYKYYYSLKRSLSYIANGSNYKPINSTVDEKAINNAFAAVIDGCINQEVLTKGVSERYNYNDSYTSLPIGNYAFKNEYNNYWLFTTDMVIQNPSLMHYISADKILWQDNDEHHILKAVEHSFRVLDFPKNNELTDTVFSKMGYSNGVFETEGNKQVSNNIYVHENTEYEFNLPAGSIVVCMAENQNILAEKTTSPFTTPNYTTHVRVVSNSIPTDAQYLRVKGYDKVFFSKNKKYTVLTSAAAGKKLGISFLMDEFIRLSHEAYQVKLHALTAAQQEITDINLHLAEVLGDMYREGYWQDNNFVEGDEDKLYSDALDNLKEISHPQATYNFKFLDLYGSDDNLDAAIKTEYPDIDTDYAAHLIDPDIDTNRWAYIDKLDKCYDQKWKTQIEINTRLSMIGQQSFTDVLAKIAEVANETKAKQTIYSKAEAIGSAGQLAADKLEGLIQANKIYILGGTSNWYTDSKGNIIFEDADGNSAMMLTGRGLMISASKSADGDWDWRTALSGKGFNCDVIATGEFSAKHIIAGTITTDKLSSSVGQELEIGSNKALTLYATVDGNRPVDGVETKHPNEGDSYIKIAAKNGNTPAYIDIQSGGKVNLYGGSSMTIGTGGKLDLTGATVNLESQGKINIKSGTTLDIQSGGVLLINTVNFKIKKNSTTNDYDVTIKGNITTTGGKIAGFTIGSSEVRDFMYTNGKSTIANEAEGVYIGSDGFGLGSRVDIGTEQSHVYRSIFQVSKNGSLFAQNATITGSITASTGNIAGFTIIETALYNNGKTSIDANVDGVYVGSNGIGLGARPSGLTRSAFKVTNVGKLYATGVDISGTIAASSGSVGSFTINSALYTNSKDSIDKNVDGVYIGSDGLGLGTRPSGLSRSAFKVTNAGKLYATGVDISGTIAASSGSVGSFTINSALYTNNKTGIDVDVAGVCISSDGIGLGARPSGLTRSAFKVTNTGALYASDADIKGTIRASTLYIGNAQANISLDSNGHISSSSIGDLSGTYATISNVDGKIDALSLDNIGNGTSVSITSTGLTVNSSGSVDFSAAQSISFKTGSISIDAIAGDLDYYDKVTGITIDGTGISMSGAFHINLDVPNSTNPTSYVHIDDNGIAMKGKKLTYIDSSGAAVDTWGRDDIIVMKRSGETEAQIIARQTAAGKTDWVLIKPYYDSIIQGNGAIGDYSDSIAISKYSITTGYAFGNNADWYQYDASVTIANTGTSIAQISVVVFFANKPFHIVQDSSLTYYQQAMSQCVTYTYAWNGTIGVSSSQKIDLTTRHVQQNLCGEGSSVYYAVTGIGFGGSRIAAHSFEATTDAKTSKVPCTVYYYP